MVCVTEAETFSICIPQVLPDTTISSPSLHESPSPTKLDIMAYIQRFFLTLTSSNTLTLSRSPRRRPASLIILLPVPLLALRRLILIAIRLLLLLLLLLLLILPLVRVYWRPMYTLYRLVRVPRPILLLLLLMLLLHVLAIRMRKRLLSGLPRVNHARVGAHWCWGVYDAARAALHPYTPIPVPVSITVRGVVGVVIVGCAGTDRARAVCTAPIRPVSVAVPLALTRALRVPMCTLPLALRVPLTLSLPMSISPITTSTPIPARLLHTLRKLPSGRAERIRRIPRLPMCAHITRSCTSTVPRMTIPDTAPSLTDHRRRRKVVRIVRMDRIEQGVVE